MSLTFAKANPRQDAPRDEQPAEAKPISPTPAPPAPVVNVQPLTANQTKVDADGKALTLAGKGHLLDLTVLNTSGSSIYLQLFDSETVPPDGSRPRRVWTVTTLQTFDGIWPAGRPFASGLCLVLSSTLTTLTKVTTASGIIEVSLLIP